MGNPRRVSGLLAACALAAGSLALTTPAFADGPIGGCSVSSPAGTIGVMQQISLFSCGDANSVTVTYANGSAGQTLNFLPGGGAGGTSQVNWSPTSTGSVTFTVPANGATGSTTIGQTGTFTTVNAPNTAQVGVATKITVNVQSNSPSAYAPTGTVTVKDGQGNVIKQMGLTPTAPNSGQSYAYWWFTAPSSGQYIFQATYSGDANATAGSPSPQDVMFASPSGNTITLTAPGTMTVGVPATLTATFVPANIQGSVGFTVNGQPISASVPIVNGSASFTWTPTAAGAATLGASYMTNGGASGSTTDKVNIVAGPAQNDVITLTQPGFGTWSPNGTYTLPNGSSTTMTASTLSGAPVTLTETGPCVVSGLTITVPVGNGQCNIQAKSAGGAGYAGVTYGYTVNAGLGQQTATVAAPLSGKIAKGRTVLLEAPGQSDTNAGQNIGWKITKGKGVCRINYPADASVTLTKLKKGSCTVKGFAPGVPGQWAPFTVMRTYKG